MEGASPLLREDAVEAEGRVGRNGVIQELVVKAPAAVGWELEVLVPLLFQLLG